MGAISVGIIGLGTMGGRIAKRLVESGFEVFGRDLIAEKEQAAESSGVRIVASPLDMASRCDFILLSLPGPAEVLEVVGGREGILSARSRRCRVIADLSTVDPATSERNARLAADLGLSYLDSPVLGRPHRCGQWTLVVGGEPSAIEKARPVLESLAARVIHIGPPGRGNVVKLLNNVMFGAINMVTAEVMAASPLLGVEPSVFFQAIAESGAATVSNLFKEIGPKIIAGDYEPAFSIDLLHKDISLAIASAERVGMPMLIAHGCQAISGVAKGKGLGAKDTSACVKVYRDWTKNHGG